MPLRRRKDGKRLPVAASNVSTIDPRPPSQPTTGYPTVTAESLLSVPWVWRCVRLTSNALAGMPLTDGPDTMEPAGPVALWDQPTGKLGYTGFHLRRDTWFTMALHGEAFYQIASTNNRGYVNGVVPINPNNVWYRLDQNTGQVIYRVDSIGRDLTDEEIIHFPMASMNGNLGGLSPVKFLARMARQDIMEGEQGQAALVGGNQNAFTYASTPQQIGPDLAQRYAEEIDKTLAGRNQTRTVVLGDGLEFKQAGISWEELELVASRRYSAVETCAAFEVPPSLLGVSLDGASTTYSNIQQDLSLFDRLTLEGYRMCFTETLSHYMDPIHISNLGLVREAPLQRAEGHAIAITNKYKTADEVREEEGLPPLTQAQKDELGLGQPPPMEGQQSLPFVPEPAMQGNGNGSGS